MIAFFGLACYGKMGKRQNKLDISIRYDMLLINGENMKVKQDQTEIFEYIKRRKHGKTFKVGVILGTTVGDVIKIGWSKCNFKEHDVFNRTIGVSVARTRIFHEEPVTTPVPPCIQRQVNLFGGRCIRYFKNTNKLEMPKR